MPNPTYNNITYAEKFIPEVEKKIVQEAKTGFLADNVWKARFIGAKTVLLPEITTPGLGNYLRDSNTLGYAKGDITTTNHQYTLDMERSRQLYIDAQDADESGIPDLVGKTVKVFTENDIIPEVDAYNISKLFATASENNHVEDYSTATSALGQLLTLINSAESATAYGNEKMVCFVDPVFYGALMSDTSVTKQINVSNFKQGGIDLKVKELNGVTIIPVAKDRMFTAYNFKDGRTSTKLADGGFEAQSNAEEVRAIIFPKDTASFIDKVDKIQVLNPNQVEDMDAYKINFRLYYGLIVKESRKDTIFALKAQQSNT